MPAAERGSWLGALDPLRRVLALTGRERAQSGTRERTTDRLTRSRIVRQSVRHCGLLPHNLLRGSSIPALGGQRGSAFSPNTIALASNASFSTVFSFEILSRA